MIGLICDNEPGITGRGFRSRLKMASRMREAEKLGGKVCCSCSQIFWNDSPLCEACVSKTNIRVKGLGGANDDL